MRRNLLILGALLAAACSAPDPGAIEWGSRHPASATDGGGPPPASTDGGNAPQTPQDGGTARDAAPAPTDAAVAMDAAPMAQNAFSGAPAYQSAPVAVSAVQEHQNRGVGTVPTGQGCLGCHNGTTATRFGVGGTVYADQAGTTGAADVEVRVVKSDYTQYADVHSDADGNFWVIDQNGFGALNGFVGVRDGKTTQLMTDALSKDGCNGCHDGNTQARIHLP